MRKLNRERDYDLKSKLIHAYKHLEAVSVNMYAHFSITGLVKEASKRLKQLMNVANVHVLILD